MARSSEAVWEDFEQRAIATILPIRADHLQELGASPPHHRDPFDRLIVAQVLGENCTLISSAARMDAYGAVRV